MGAPVGNQNASKGRRWAAAVERAIAAWPARPDDTDCSDLVKGLNQAAFAFVTKLYGESDLGFFKELGDRLDGKSVQALSGPDGGPMVVTRIELVPLGGAGG